MEVTYEHYGMQGYATYMQPKIWHVYISAKNKTIQQYISLVSAGLQIACIEGANV